MSEPKPQSLQQRWAADPVRLDQVAASPRSRTPDGQVVVVPLAVGDTALGLLWADANGAGYLPRSVGAPDVLQAASYAWRVLNTAGTGALQDPHLWAPAYDLGDPTPYPTLQQAAEELLT